MTGDYIQKERGGITWASVSVSFSSQSGPILTWAVSAEASGVDLQTVGIILMVVGAVGGLISLIFWSSWGGFGGYRRETVVHEAATASSSGARRRETRGRPRASVEGGAFLAPPSLRFSGCTNSFTSTKRPAARSSPCAASSTRTTRRACAQLLRQGRRRWRAAPADGPRVVLDLTAVTVPRFDRLGTMIGALRRVREAGGEIARRAPESPASRIFEITGLDQVLDIRASREADALRP